MIQQTTNYEVLLLTSSHSSDKHPCNKKCNGNKNCPVHLNYATIQARRIAKGLICLFEKYSMDDIKIPLTIIHTKSFVQVNTVEPAMENKLSINPHSVFSLIDLN